MTEEEKVPDLISVGAQAVADTGKRLGLTWTLRPGKVAIADPLTVIYDGDPDQTPIGMISLIGYLSKGTRVMAEFVPPAGNYVVGWFAGVNVGRSSILRFATATSDTNLTNVEAVPAGLSASALTVTTTSPGAVWEAELVVGFEETVTGTTIGIGRLYVDSVLQGPTVLYTMRTAGDRDTAGQNFSGTFTAAGSHNFEVRVLRTVNTGTQNANGINTTLLIKVYE
jgi:hypothetical protein